MCGRFTRNYTWAQIQALYRLTAPAAIPNLQPRFNACPTDPADTIVKHDGKRELVEMRWGLVPFWWSKPLKELRLATFNARVETVTTRPFFREPFKKKRCLMPVSGYYEWQDTSDGKQLGISPPAMGPPSSPLRAYGTNGRTARPANG
jgi:putative SOS response-associated peptidase YedK